MTKLLHVIGLFESEVIDVPELVAKLEIRLDHHHADTDRHVEREGCEVDALNKVSLDFNFKSTPKPLTFFEMWLFDAMITFGGSPTGVKAPPMLE